MKLESTRTNGARLLDTLGIAYEPRSYEIDLEDLTATSVARKIGLPPEQVFKTLLLQAAPGEYFFAVVPGDQELDLKKMAVVTGSKKLELASLKQLAPLTGYVRGGVTVLAAKKPFPAVADETIVLFERISISAGQRGLQLVLSPTDYLRAASASLADLTRATSGRSGAP